MSQLIIVYWLRWRRTVFFTGQCAYKSYKYRKLWGTIQDVHPLKLLKGTRRTSPGFAAHAYDQTATEISALSLVSSLPYATHAALASIV